MSEPKPNLNLIDTTERVEAAEVVGNGTATHGVVRESPVDILYMVEARQGALDLRSQNDRRYIRVKLYGKERPDLISFTDIRIPGKSKREMAKAVEFAAAALAERMKLLYGEKGGYDPFFAAKAARKHFEELCDFIAKQPTS